MNGLTGYTEPRTKQERRERKAKLEREREQVRSQLTELKSRLPQLRGAGPSKGPSKEQGGAVSKKRPAPGLAGDAKRQKIEAERAKRVNSIWQQCQTILKTLLKSVGLWSATAELCEVIVTACTESLLTMQKDAFAFSKPVNPVTSKCPDYLDIIKRPMDLGTVQKKFPGKGKPTEKSPGRQEYKSPEEFRDDVRLVWSNCRTYNAVGHAVRTMGDSLSEIWEKKWALSGIETKWEEEMRRQELEEQVLIDFPAYPNRAAGLLALLLLLLLFTAAIKQLLRTISAGACRGSQSRPAAASSGRCPAAETGAHREPARLLSTAGGVCHEL